MYSDYIGIWVDVIVYIYEGLLLNPAYMLIMGINLVIGLIAYKFNKTFK